MTDGPSPSANTKPFLVSLEKGKRYAWCACGRSQRQPFCDGAHGQTDIKPVVFTAEKTEDVLLCGCKRTKNAPICDGSHNNIDDAYEVASAEEIERTKNAPVIARDHGAFGKAVLDGGAYVLTPDLDNASAHGALASHSLVGPSDGANDLSLMRFTAKAETSWRAHEGGETALYIIAGSGAVNINGMRFNVEPETGVFVRKGEAFRLEPDETLEVIAAMSPDADPVAWPHDAAGGLAKDDQHRCIGVHPDARQKMADRFYQVLVGEETGSTEMTQFIGEIPKSRAAFHRHLYEEAIVILSGEGVMWTPESCAPVKPGDVIYLPPRQEHSLECTVDEGMRLMGVFYPAGSPAINY